VGSIDLKISLDVHLHYKTQKKYGKELMKSLLNSGSQENAETKAIRNSLADVTLSLQSRNRLIEYLANRYYSLKHSSLGQSIDPQILSEEFTDLHSQLDFLLGRAQADQAKARQLETQLLKLYSQHEAVTHIEAERREAELVCLRAELQDLQSREAVTKEET
jgi:chromosome segregation ATPase